MLKKPIAGSLAAAALHEVGAPRFVAEMVRVSTLRNDRKGKRVVYAPAGIGEYLLFGPASTLLPTPIGAWRLPSPSSRVYQPWLPGVDGAAG